MPETRTRDEYPIPVLVELGARFRELEAAGAGVQPRRVRRPKTAVVLAAVVLVAFAAVAGAGGLFHIGSPLEPPPPGDVLPAQIPLPDTATVEPVRSPDPNGGPEWGIRVAKNKAGEPCFAVNRVLDGKFGTVTGTEFHELPLRGPGSCGPAPAPVRYEVLQGFGRGTDGGRTILGGLVSADVQSVVVIGPDGPRELEISAHGAFVTAYKGVFRPRQLPVTVTLKDGTTQTYRAPGVPG
jgi:hypothetical protein